MTERKHASEMNYQEIEAYLLENGRRAIWAGGSEPLGYKVDASAYLGVIRELKAHQSEQDAEIARLRGEINMMIDGLHDATAPVEAENARLRAQLDGVLAAVDAEPELPDEDTDEAKDMIAAMLSDRDTLIEGCRILVRLTKDGIKERILAAKGES